MCHQSRFYFNLFSVLCKENGQVQRALELMHEGQGRKNTERMLNKAPSKT